MPDGIRPPPSYRGCVGAEGRTRCSQRGGPRHLLPRRRVLPGGGRPFFASRAGLAHPGDHGGLRRICAPCTPMTTSEPIVAWGWSSPEGPPYDAVFRPRRDGVGDAVLDHQAEHGELVALAQARASMTVCRVSGRGYADAVTRTADLNRRSGRACAWSVSYSEQPLQQLELKGAPELPVVDHDRRDRLGRTRRECLA